MNLKSIRWKLPLTYAGVATLTVLVLGGTLLAIVRSYYQAQELAYLQKNALSISGAVAPYLVKGANGKVDLTYLNDHIAFLSFLSQTKVRLLDGQGKELGSYSFVGNNDMVYVSAVTLPDQPAGSEPKPGSTPEGPIVSGNVTGTTVSRPAFPDSLAIQIVQSAPETVIAAGASTGEKIKILSLSRTDVSAGEAGALGKPAGEKVVYSMIPAVGTMYGFELQGSGVAPQRSNQVYSQAIYSSDGARLGSVELSQGPAYGTDIVLGVAQGWIVAGLVAILVAGFAGWWISRKMSAPLLELSAVTSQMAGGDLTARATTGSQDEFGRLARSFNEMADRMEETVNALRRFASDAAHELHTPITALHTNLEIAASDQAERGEKDPALQQAWEEMLRLETLTRDLLDLSRIEAHTPAPSEPIELTGWVRPVCEPYASAAEQNNVEFTLETPEEPVAIAGQPGQLSRALENLLSNAVKFTTTGGNILVKVWNEAETVVIAVENDGIGIPAEDLPYIFNRFHRGRNATGYPGSGLGLPIAKAIVDQHHGTISVTSNGRTKFVIRLPRGE